jgi:hypothetical protein
MELSSRMLTRNGRFLPTDRNRGDKRVNSIINNTATWANGVLSAGLMSHGTTPAKPWFRFLAPDPDLNDYQPVKEWLEQVQQRMQLVFQKSNFYSVLHGMYEELGVFGTAVAIVQPNFKRVIHLYPSSIGEFTLATDYEGDVNTLYRKFQKTVGEVVPQFGYDNCSTQVQELWKRGDRMSPVEIVHVIAPRDDEDRDSNYSDTRNMPWKSCYYEVGSAQDKFLRETGYPMFPVLAPRWRTAGGDVYGESPGMIALGDTNGLQQKELRLAQGIDYKTLPPTQAPQSMQGQEININPGSTTIGGDGQIKTIWEVDLDLSHMETNIEKNEGRIHRAFFTPLFQMLASLNDSTQRTIAEIAARNEETISQIGPHLERQQNEIQRPAIDVTFARMLETHLIPPPPPEMRGKPLGVEFISPLAQAQRMIGINSVDRWITGMANAAKLNPEALDRLNIDGYVDTSHSMLGVPPKLLISLDKAKKVRDARNRAMAAKEQVQMANTQAASAKNLATAPTSGPPNALTDILGATTGYTNPQPTFPTR